MPEWRAQRNERARLQLERARPDVFPAPVLVHSLTQSWTPALPRLAVESYWRAHPLRADRLARGLAARSGAPEGWSWRLSRDEETRPTSFRLPPAPYREARWDRGPGFCCLCGQMVFRFGWHRDLWQAGAPNTRARWHAACVMAWKLWNAPGEHLRLLSRLQRRRCAVTGKRLLRSAEADHRVPLFSVWRDQRDRPWPELLTFWGFPNLQAINESAHRAKTVLEAKSRAVERSSSAASSRAGRRGDPEPEPRRAGAWLPGSGFADTAPE
ncbi:hypothetical protein M8523_01885 [Hyphomicrobiales bacterium BP6-180914]|uniref:Uncharacterized protein n=1 Tax=Lichenifustis flavocetrariae TaxID=2949735 RepID=A0AA42CGN8_9HYPH|nr:hypothetical protein [Lichenifustis flavocetrariae]MCW6506768.1 hypothetical protein [Lichenifustis flavocetrariae]